VYALDRLKAKSPRGQVATGNLTPDQAAFVQNIPAGRLWYADPIIGTHAPAHRLHRHPDGTGDIVRLDTDGEKWFDGGGGASVDFKVGMT
jgi:hypothetical protein